MEENGKSRVSAPASYTVEASYIMAIVIFSLAILIHTAYERCRQETGVMRLHHMTELVRGQGDEKKMEFTAGGANGYGERKKRTAEGAIRGGGWEKEIVVEVHRPESLMRMLTIFQSDGEGERDRYGNHG